jgi:NAD(P)-dependent dehydrogenase (short-subunit alcohol dehydrogenase family)
MVIRDVLRLRLEGKIAIVTGGASGIGRATCEVFAREGAHVVIADKNIEVARHVEQTLGGAASAYWYDAVEPASVAALVANVMDRFGRIDVLHNNAGLALDDDTTVVDTDLEAWDRTFALNVRGYVACCKYVVPVMIDSGGGSIINTASAAGFAGGIYHSAYGASKAAVMTLTKFVATQYGVSGVRCNAIAPGPIATPGLKGSEGSEVLVPLALRQLLTRRMGMPEDVATLALFLASDESSFITGQTIACDGGLLTHQPYVADLWDAGWKQ